MKITCTQENLLAGVLATASVAEKSSNLPVLSNVLIRAEKNTITLTATNLELGVQVVVRGKVEKEGAITVPARLLSDYIKSLPHSTVTLEADGQNMKITAGTHHSSIASISAEDFPPLPKVERKGELSVVGVDFKKALSMVSFAVSRDEARPEIGGVFCKAQKDTLIFAATDGHRLAEYQLKNTNTTTNDGVIIPLQTITEVSRLLPDDAVIIAFGETQILFATEELTIISRLIEGTYLDYHALFPQDFSTRATVNREELITAARATSLFVRRNINDLTVVVKKNELQLSAEAAQIGRGNTAVACEREGDEVTIVFNAHYLLEGLQSFSEEQVVIAMNGPQDPAMLIVPNSSQHNYLIMPITI